MFNIVILRGLRVLFVCRELFHLLDYDGGGTVGVEEFCEGVLKAGASAPLPNMHFINFMLNVTMFHLFSLTVSAS